jgi:hypothetical protein
MIGKGPLYSPILRRHWPWCLFEHAERRPEHSSASEPRIDVVAPPRGDAAGGETWLLQMQHGFNVLHVPAKLSGFLAVLLDASA